MDLVTGKLNVKIGCVLSFFFLFTGMAELQAQEHTRIVDDPIVEIDGKNYRRTITPLVPFNYIIKEKWEMDETEKRITIEYFDDWGRPKHTVDRSIGGNGENLATLHEYDAFNREVASWLPTPCTDIYNLSVDDLKSQAMITYNDQTPYSSMSYETAFDGRVLKETGPGSSWKEKGIGSDYLINTSSGVLSCVYYYVENEILRTDGNYPPNELQIKKSTDEDGRVSYLFYDKEGQAILYRQLNGNEMLDTYYVYDNAGLKRYVLSPMINNNISADQLNKYAYSYKYDKLSRCIEKKLPGCAPLYMVYDQSDRLLFSQDGEQRKVGLWSFQLYDTFRRLVLTGTCKNTDTGSYANKIPAALYDAASDYLGSGYRLNGISLVGAEILTVNYYDHYGFLNLPAIGSTKAAQLTYSDKSGYDARYVYNLAGIDYAAKSLLTGTRVKVLDDSNEIVTVNYYDDHSRVVQTLSTNHIGGYEKEYISWSFTGKPLKRLHEHKKRVTPVTELYSYGYDSFDRLLSTTLCLNGKSTVTLSENSYDELCCLKSKKLHGGVETVNYSYNIRNWVTRINSTRFQEELLYEDAFKSCFNGNIGEVKCKAGDSQNEKIYTFEYDPLNRLSSAFYFENKALSSSVEVTSYDEAAEYDRNGNISRMKRNGYEFQQAAIVPRIIGLPPTFGTIDDLTYTYNGNQLKSVEDAASLDPLYKDAFSFVDGFSADEEYRYNSNGSLLIDKNKGITQIDYNVVNLPSMITFSPNNKIGFTYDATGMKCRVSYWSPPEVIVWPEGLEPAVAPMASLPAITDPSITLGPSSWVDYCENIIYTKNVLSKILTDEGYADFDANGNFVYHYFLKDHQGNNRVVFNHLGAVEQVNHYYPFGTPFASGKNLALQQYKYSGKELERMHGLNMYDHGARMYDSSIGRWTMIMDPLCEKYYSVSPYAFCNNNPVRYVDPDGRSTWVMDNHNGTYRVVGGDLKDKDKNIYVYRMQDGGLVRGESIGESDLISSFYNSDASAWSAGSIIDLKDNSGINFLSSFYSEEPSITDYMANATAYKKYDFKRAGTAKNDQKDVFVYYYRGMPVRTENGKTIYSSARDIGNYTAGYIAGHLLISWSLTREKFDELQSIQDGHSAIEGYSSQNAQWRGWSVGRKSLRDHPWKTFRWITKSIPGGIKWLLK